MKMSILRFLFICTQIVLCFAYFNIEEKFVNSSNDNVRFKVKTQRYKKIINTSFDESNWTFLTPFGMKVEKVIECGKACQHTTDCCGFFFNRSAGASPNCFLNDQPFRSDHYLQDTDIDLYEIRVSKRISLRGGSRGMANICVGAQKNKSLLVFMRT